LVDIYRARAIAVGLQLAQPNLDVAGQCAGGPHHQRLSRPAAVNISRLKTSAGDVPLFDLIGILGQPIVDGPMIVDACRPQKDIKYMRDFNSRYFQ